MWGTSVEALVASLRPLALTLLGRHALSWPVGVLPLSRPFGARLGSPDRGRSPLERPDPPQDGVFSSSLPAPEADLPQSPVVMPVREWLMMMMMMMMMRKRKSEYSVPSDVPVWVRTAFPSYSLVVSSSAHSTWAYFCPGIVSPLSTHIRVLVRVPDNGMGEELRRL